MASTMGWGRVPLLKVLVVYLRLSFQLHAEVTEEVQRLSIELEKSRTQTQDLARELRKTQVSPGD